MSRFTNIEEALEALGFQRCTVTIAPGMLENPTATTEDIQGIGIWCRPSDGATLVQPFTGGDETTMPVYGLLSNTTNANDQIDTLVAQYGAKQS